MDVENNTDVAADADTTNQGLSDDKKEEVKVDRPSESKSEEKKPDVIERSEFNKVVRERDTTRKELKSKDEKIAELQALLDGEKQKNETFLKSKTLDAWLDDATSRVKDNKKALAKKALKAEVDEAFSGIFEEKADLKKIAADAERWLQSLDKELFDDGTHLPNPLDQSQEHNWEQYGGNFFRVPKDIRDTMPDEVFEKYFTNRLVVGKMNI